MPTGYAPYGDIVSVNTPHLDRLTQQLYQEEQRRELQRQADLKNLDNEFARNMSGIRDADIPELTKRYGNYKLKYQSLAKKRGGGTPEEQLDVLRSKADIYDVLNKSKVEKEKEDSWAKLIPNDKKGIFADDAADKVRLRRQKPLSQLNPDEDKKLMYEYSVPDFDKYNKMAIGTPTEVRGKTTANGINDETPVYKIGNNPSQMYETMLSNVVKDNKARNAIGLINNSFGSDEEKQALMDKYFQKIKDPKFIAAYGEPQPFPQSAQTELGNAVMLQTMKNVVDAPIPEPKLEVKANPDRSLKQREKFAMEQQARAAKNSLARLYVYANIQDRKPETIGRNIDALIAQHIEDARNNNGEVATDNATFESITGKKKTSSSVLMFDEANNKYTYGTKDATTGEVKIVGEVPVDLGRIKLTKTYKTGLDSKYNTGKDIKVPKGTYIIKGKKYSEDELIKMGYTIDQIKPYKQ